MSSSLSAGAAAGGDLAQCQKPSLVKSAASNDHPLMPAEQLANYPDLVPESSSLKKKSPPAELCADVGNSLGGELPALAEFQKLRDCPDSPTQMRESSLCSIMPLELSACDLSDVENERSNYEAVLNPDLKNVSLTIYARTGNLNHLSRISPRVKKRRIKVQFRPGPPDDSDVSSVDSDPASNPDSNPDSNLDGSLQLEQAPANSKKEAFNQSIQELLDSTDDFDESMLANLDLSLDLSDANTATLEPIEEYTAEQERRDARYWQKIVLPNGRQHHIDMRVIEPYKRVLSHGGYLKAGGHNAIVVFSACFLPDRSRIDYDYVMDNLFLYVLSTLDQLVTEDYVLVYLHGSASSRHMPTFGWLKRCYHMIDRKLRKNLKQLYLVHPTFWLKAIVMMSKPFISTKFYRKLSFMNSLQELFNRLPVEHASIPERVKTYDRSKFCT